MAEQERKRRSKKTSADIIPIGETPRAQLEREFSISRRIGIDLMKMFESAAYISPSDLKEKLEDLAKMYNLDEININQVGSYLLGVLDQDDFDSPLRKTFERISLTHRDEFIARQALTTIAALVENFGTDRITTKVDASQS